MIVLRAGDVIPQVLSPAPHVAERKNRPPPTVPPERCPICHTPTVKPEGSVFTRCPNRTCPGRRWQLLTAFAGVMDIDGLGEKLVTLFMDLGWVKTAADFYRLSAEQISGQPGFGEVSAAKLVNAIEASKTQPFGRVLFAVGIEEVGYVTGRNLAQQFRTVEALLAASPEEIEQTSGVGPKMAATIHEQLADPQMRELLADLQREGLTLAAEGPPPGEGPLAGKTLVLTGTLPELTREDATTMIVAAGGRSPARCPNAPTTSSPGTARVRSWPRRRSWRCRCSTRRVCARWSARRCCWRSRPPSNPQPELTRSTVMRYSLA